MSDGFTTETKTGPAPTSALTIDRYQMQTHETAIYPPHLALGYLALGLAGEAGEVANKIKKVYRDTHGIVTPETRAAIQKELGDVLWYAAELATMLGIRLSEAAQGNLDALADRKARGVLGGSGDDR